MNPSVSSISGKKCLALFLDQLLVIKFKEFLFHRNNLFFKNQKTNRKNGKLQVGWGSFPTIEMGKLYVRFNELH